MKKAMVILITAALLSCNNVPHDDPEKEDSTRQQRAKQDTAVKAVDSVVE